MGTAGSASSLEKRAGGDTGTALQADSTVLLRRYVADLDEDLADAP